MMSDPGPPIGNGQFATYLRRLHDMIVARTILGVPGARRKETSQGIFFEPIAQGGGSSKGISIAPYNVVSHPDKTSDDPAGGDYILCRAAGADPGSAPVKVLKPWDLFFSTSNRSPSISYSQYSAADQSRVATNPVGAVTQYITKKYLPGDVLWVVSPIAYTDATGNPATLLDLNTAGRTFAAP